MGDFNRWRRVEKSRGKSRWKKRNNGLPQGMASQSSLTSMYTNDHNRCEAKHKTLPRHR